MEANEIMNIIVGKKIDLYRAGVKPTSALIPRKEYVEIMYTLDKEYGGIMMDCIYSINNKTILGLNIIVSTEVETIQVGYII